MAANLYPSLISLLLISTISCEQKTDFILKTSGETYFVTKFSSYYYVSFDLSEPQQLKIMAGSDIKKVEISPEKDQINFKIVNKNSINITLTNPGQYLIRINDSVKIFLFVEKPNIKPEDQLINIVTKYKVDPSGQTNETQKIQKALNEVSGTGRILFFPAGTYKSGQLYIKSNSRVHLDRCAVLTSDTGDIRSYFPADNVENKRFIYIKNAENVEITGSGTINGNGNYFRSRFGDDARFRLILAVNSRNILVEGITLKDPGSWNTHLIKCENVVLRNVKLLNDIEVSNTDGFDPDASRHVLIEDCFAYCGDDNVAIKTTDTSDLSGEVYDITVKGCVFLTKKSALKVGTETRTGSMKKILFENNDVIECDRGMALYVRDGATLDTIEFINNRFERNYPDAQRKAIHFKVDKRNPDSKLGVILNVLIKDCIFDTPFPNKSVIEYDGKGTGINVTIDNLKIAGEKALSPGTAGIDIINSKVIFR